MVPLTPFCWLCSSGNEQLNRCNTFAKNKCASQQLTLTKVGVLEWARSHAMVITRQ